MNMMTSLPFSISRLALLLALSSGIAQAAVAPQLSLEAWPQGQALEAQSLMFVPGAASSAQLSASPKTGLSYLSAQGKVAAHMPGAFEGLDSRTLGSQVLVATLDNQRQQPMLTLLDSAKGAFGPGVYLPARDYGVTGLCLYRGEAEQMFVFLVGEEGRGEQWLVADAGRLLPEPRLVRQMPFPPNAEFCQADDAAHRLLVNEESIGWWAYPAGPEDEVAREPIALRKPFGNVPKAAGALAVVPGGLLGLDPKGKALQLYQQEGEHWAPVASLPIKQLNKPEGLAVRKTDKGFEVLINDDDGAQLYKGELNWQPTPVVVPPVLAQVAPSAQSEPVGRQGDAADDPAIWVHPSDPEKSRVIGTNKKQGLLAYDLAGKQLQELPVGRLNNVDVRPNFKLGQQNVDLAVASNRDNNSLSLFSIDRATGEMQPAGDVPTPLKAIYGICLFQPASGEIYAFANDKDGTFLQYRLSGASGKASGELVRQFKVDSQPEGCVADDQRQRLFVGEEDVGVWALDARADQPATLTSVIKVGDAVHADVEGLALYQSDKHDYLVISSQGNDSYVVLDAEPPYRLRGAFRVGLNAAAGIDGASETDGLEVTSAHLGGPYGQGMLVVQDGRKRMPEQAQNFKFVPWADVAKALGLP